MASGSASAESRSAVSNPRQNFWYCPKPPLCVLEPRGQHVPGRLLVGGDRREVVLDEALHPVRGHVLRRGRRGRRRGLLLTGPGGRSASAPWVASPSPALDPSSQATPATATIAATASATATGPPRERRAARAAAWARARGACRRRRWASAAGRPSGPGRLAARRAGSRRGGPGRQEVAHLRHRPAPRRRRSSSSPRAAASASRRWSSRGGSSCTIRYSAPSTLSPSVVRRSAGERVEERGAQRPDVAGRSWPAGRRPPRGRGTPASRSPARSG